MYESNTNDELSGAGTTAAAEVAEATSARPVRAPAVDIYENDEGYLVIADLPGVASDGVDIRYDGGELRLQAHPHERDWDLMRVFKIPEGVDAAAIDAALDNGVLELRLPKVQSPEPRRIKVRASA